MKIMARPDGPGCRPSDDAASRHPGKAASIPRAEAGSDYRPQSGRYVDMHGRGCFVCIGREPKAGEDGSVIVSYDDGSWTSAYFRTFRQWGFRPARDKHAKREDAQAAEARSAASPVGAADAPIPSPAPTEEG